MQPRRPSANVCNFTLPRLHHERTSAASPSVSTQARPEERLQGGPVPSASSVLPTASEMQRRDDKEVFGSILSNIDRDGGLAEAGVVNQPMRQSNAPTASPQGSNPTIEDPKENAQADSNEGPIAPTVEAVEQGQAERARRREEKRQRRAEKKKRKEERRRRKAEAVEQAAALAAAQREEEREERLAKGDEAQQPATESEVAPLAEENPQHASSVERAKALLAERQEAERIRMAALKEDAHQIIASRELA